jgi:hypothetical protein
MGSTGPAGIAAHLRAHCAAAAPSTMVSAVTPATNQVFGVGLNRTRLS